MSTILSIPIQCNQVHCSMFPFVLIQSNSKLYFLKKHEIFCSQKLCVIVYHPTIWTTWAQPKITHISLKHCSRAEKCVYALGGREPCRYSCIGHCACVLCMHECYRSSDCVLVGGLVIPTFCQIFNPKVCVWLSACHRMGVGNLFRLSADLSRVVLCVGALKALGY